jgi:two-component system heavy metal sensor histidine kinase CusS
VHCNAALVRRAVVNLLTNAIKHTARGGTIRVDVEAADGHARLSVHNPGAPIAPEVAARMFDRFYRADAAREGSGESHGLGLAIVKAIARMHDGATFVAVEPDGNRVGVELPALAGGTRADAPEAAPAPAAREEMSSS